LQTASWAEPIATDNGSQRKNKKHLKLQDSSEMTCFSKSPKVKGRCGVAFPLKTGLPNGSELKDNHGSSVYFGENAIMTKAGVCLSKHLNPAR